MRAKLQALEEEGRCWFRNALSEADLTILAQTCAVEKTPGRRLTWSSEIESVLGHTSHTARMASPILPGCKPVRLVAFNKLPDLNWALPWHQDRVIAIKERHNVDGYGSWSQKAGTWHCEPPLEILQRMVFARIHLDDADEQNGCLELALGTHKNGRINATEAKDKADAVKKELCLASRGDVLFVKALTLHKSSSASVNAQRRALRVDYSADALPSPLMWAL